MFKKIVFVLLAMALVVSVSTPAFAQARHGTRNSRPLTATGMFLDSAGVAMTGGWWIYGISLLADSTNCVLGVVDVATAAEIGSANPRDEIGEATQWDTAEKVYSTPQYYTNGVGGVLQLGGVGYVTYGPAQ